MPYRKAVRPNILKCRTRVCTQYIRIRNMKKPSLFYVRFMGTIVITTTEIRVYAIRAKATKKKRIFRLKIPTLMRNALFFP